MDETKRARFIQNRRYFYMCYPFNLNALDAHLKACEDLWKEEGLKQSKYVQKVLIGKDRPHEF